MKNGFLVLCLLVGQLAFGQSALPVIRATAKQVMIRDGTILDKDAWTLAPQVRPDVYVADRTRQPKWVTFYTDIDSIRVKINPGTSVDFIILLNGKDSCYTRISSAIPAENQANKQQKLNPDTIPFRLTAHDAIQVKSVVNGTDTVQLHFDIGSLDFRMTKEAILNKTSLVPNKADVLAGSAKVNYARLLTVKTIQLGKLLFTAPTFVPVAMAAREMDGRFGWNVFEGKIVEIDYDKQRLLIHSFLPKQRSGYVKSPIQFIRSMVCIEAIIPLRGKQYAGKFLFDTGSEMAMILDSVWAAKRNFPDDLTVTSTTTFKDGRGVRYEARKVLVPRVLLNTFSLANVPTTRLGSPTPIGYEVNCFGNGLLKRFNTILDLKNDFIYLKPNSFFDLPYKEKA